MHVNLIPVELRLRMMARRKLRSWAILWGILVVAATCTLSCHYRSVLLGRQRLNSLAARVRPLHKIQEQTFSLQGRIQALQAELKLLQQIEPTDHSLELLMILTAAAKSTGEPLQIQQLRLLNERIAGSTESQNTAAKGDNTTPVQQSTLTLQGVAASDRALTDFVEALRRSPPLEKVELKSSSRWQTEMLNGRQFQVECRYKE